MFLADRRTSSTAAFMASKLGPNQEPRLCRNNGLAQLRQMRLSRDQLLIKLGEAKQEAGAKVWKLVHISVGAPK